MSSTRPARPTASDAATPTAEPVVRAAAGIPIRVLIAIAGSMLLSIAVFGIASALGATMLVTTPAAAEPIRIEAVQVVVSLAGPMLIVGALVWLLGRTRPAIVRWAAWIGLAAGVLTAGMPFSATSDLTTALALGVMHAMAGIAWFLALRIRSRA